MTSFIETRDRTRLFYTDWGKGKPVLFIHGWALSSDMWEYQMPYLARQGLRCIAYDKRGCAPIDLTGRRTAQAIAGSQLKVYEGAAHGLLITEKDPLNSDLFAFIQSQ